jgi:hypothetical protein
MEGGIAGEEEDPHPIHPSLFFAVVAVVSLLP